MNGQEPWPYPCLPFDPDNSIDWPTSPSFGSPPNFGRLVIADIDGDGDPDGVVTSNGLPVVLWKIALYDAPQLIRFPAEPDPTSVADVAALPIGGAADKDAVVMTDERGLFKVTHANGHFEDPLPLGGTAWADAAPIHVEDLIPGGDLDVVGVATDHRTVMWGRISSNVLVPGATVFEPHTVKDAVAVDWNHDGTREVVVLTIRGLRIHDSATGALIATVTHTLNPGCITRFHSSDAPGGELLAWARGTSTGASQLVLTGHLYFENAGDLNLTLCEVPSAIQPLALLAGNYDGDAAGNEELLLVHGVNQTAVVLMNQGTSPHFVPGDDEKYDIVPLAEVPQLQSAVGIPAFAQLDGEGPDPLNPSDIAFPVSNSAQVHVFLKLPFYRDRASTGAPPTSADVVDERTEFHTVQLEPGMLRLAFHVLPRYATYDKVDVTVWHQPSQTEYVQHNAVMHTRDDLLDPVAVPYQYVDLPYDFPSGACWGNTNDHGPLYYTEIRFVIDGPPEIRSRAFTGGFRLDNCETYDNRPYLIDLGIPGEGFDLNTDNGLGNGQAPWSRNTVGIYVPMSSQPPFQDGLGPPVPGGLTPSTGTHPILN